MKRVWILFVLLTFGCSPPIVNTDRETQGETLKEGSTSEEKTTTGEATQEQSPSDDGIDAGITESMPEKKTEVIAETESVQETSIETFTEPTPETKPEAHPDATPEIKPEAHPDATPEMKPETGPKTCQERLNQSNSDLSAERKKYLSCAANTECTSVGIGTECRGACPVPVNTVGKPKVQALVTKINQTYCKDYRQDNCPYATPKCVNGKPVCHQKKCELYDCRTRGKKARDIVEDLRKQNLTCRADTDCVLFWSGTKCAGACQKAVNKTGEPIVKASITDINRGICETYQSDQCPYATPRCISAKAKCSNKVCVMVTKAP